MLQLHDLPNELLCRVTHYLDTEQNIDSLARTNRHLYHRTNALLYRHNAIHQNLFALLWAADHGVLNTAAYAVHASQKSSNRVDIFHQALSITIRAGHTSIAEFLLSQEGVNPNLQYQGKEDKFCKTFLARAAQAGHMDMINLLLSTNIVDPNLGDDIGRPPIAYAGFSGQGDVVKKLLATPGVDPDLKDRDGRTPLSWTVSYGSEVAVSHFLSQLDVVDVNAAVATDNMLKKGWTPLMFALNMRATGMAKLLLQVPNIDAGHQSARGRTALHLAVASGSKEIVQILLEKGVNPNMMSPRCPSPLFGAASSGYLSILQLLYKAGADPDAATRTGDTPLTIASGEGHTDIVRFLLETKRVDPAAQGIEDKRNSLSFAAENGDLEIVSLLLMQDGHGNPDAKDYKGRLPLSYAVENGDLEIIKSIVAKSSAVDLSAVDFEGRTILSYASERDLPEIKELLTARNGAIH